MKRVSYNYITHTKLARTFFCMAERTFTMFNFALLKPSVYVCVCTWGNFEQQLFPVSSTPAEYGYYVLWSAPMCHFSMPRLISVGASLTEDGWSATTTFPNEDCTSVPWFERSINKEICDWFIWLFAPADNMWTSNRLGDASLRRAPVFQSFQHFTLVLLFFF